jgi:hypothetical protein
MWYVFDPAEATGYVVRVPGEQVARVVAWWLGKFGPSVDYAPHESGICGRDGRPCGRCLRFA